MLISSPFMQRYVKYFKLTTIKEKKIYLKKGHLNST